MSPKKKVTKKAASKGFSDFEKSAIKERAKELKAEAEKADGKAVLLAAIDEMKGQDRTMAKRIHEIVTANAPSLMPKTWYGMPAYFKDDKAVCFFQPALKFKARYSTLGFNDGAKLDEGSFWPTSFAVIEMNPAVEAKIAALVKKAAG